MSQIGEVSQSGGADVEALRADDGNLAVPTLGVINVYGAGGTATTASGSTLTIDGSAGGLNQEQVIYVGKAGNDANSGLNINNPVLTLGQAITLVNAETPGTGNRWLIYILDGGSYSESISIPTFTTIWGSGASIVGDVTFGDFSTLDIKFLTGGITVGTAFATILCTNAYISPSGGPITLGASSSSRLRIRASRITLQEDISNPGGILEIECLEFVGGQHLVSLGSSTSLRASECLDLIGNVPPVSLPSLIMTNGSGGLQGLNAAKVGQTFRETGKFTTLSLTNTSALSGRNSTDSTDIDLVSVTSGNLRFHPGSASSEFVAGDNVRAAVGGSTAVIFTGTVSSTNVPASMWEFSASSSGSVADGFGGRIDIAAETETADVYEQAVGFASTWLDATAATVDSAAIIFTRINSGSYTNALQVSNSGLSTDSGTSYWTFSRGTYTPIVSGTAAAGAGTYSVQVGRYTRVGNAVSVSGNMTWSAHTGTGNTRFGNLPFTSGNVANQIAVPSISLENFLFTATTTPTGKLNVNATTWDLYEMSGLGTLTAVALDTAASAAYSLTYFTP